MTDFTVNRAGIARQHPSRFDRALRLARDLDRWAALDRARAIAALIADDDDDPTPGAPALAIPVIGDVEVRAVA